MDSELLLKVIGYFPDYLSALPRTLLRCFWTTFVETDVRLVNRSLVEDIYCSWSLYFVIYLGLDFIATG